MPALGKRTARKELKLTGCDTRRTCKKIHTAGEDGPLRTLEREAETTTKSFAKRGKRLEP